MKFKSLFSLLDPGFAPISLAEKIRSSVAALFCTLLLGETLRWLPDGGHPLLLFASMAAASVLLFTTPHSPMVQPYPLLAGNLFSGAAGWLCSQFILDPVLAASCAVGLSILIMHLTRSLHPPGAATAMIIVLNVSQVQHYGWIWVGSAVLANTIIVLFLAIIINNLIHVGRYPVNHTHPIRAKPSPHELVIEDIDWALAKMEGVIDVNEEDLLDIYRLAAEHAKIRLK